MNSIPNNTRAYVCLHIFEKTSPVLFVSRPEGDWCFLCGAIHGDEPDEYRVVGVGHLIEEDPTVAEVIDLAPDWEAERGAPGGNWIRTRLDEEH